MKLLIDVMNENFATKSDLKSEVASLKSELKSDIASLRSELKSDITSVKFDMKELEYKLTIKLGTMMTLAIGITATLVKLIPAFGH